MKQAHKHSQQRSHPLSIFTTLVVFSLLCSVLFSVFFSSYLFNIPISFPTSPCTYTLIFCLTLCNVKLVFLHICSGSSNYVKSHIIFCLTSPIKNWSAYSYPPLRTHVQRLLQLLCSSLEVFCLVQFLLQLVQEGVLLLQVGEQLTPTRPHLLQNTHGCTRKITRRHRKRQEERQRGGREGARWERRGEVAAGDNRRHLKLLVGLFHIHVFRVSAGRHINICSKSTSLMSLCPSAN